MKPEHEAGELYEGFVAIQFVMSEQLLVYCDATQNAFTLAKEGTDIRHQFPDLRKALDYETADAYATDVRQLWEAFQDIGDGKFTRKEPKGLFPSGATGRVGPRQHPPCVTRIELCYGRQRGA
jgi:hypothetical protein